MEKQSIKGARFRWMAMPQEPKSKIQYREGEISTLLLNQKKLIKKLPWKFFDIHYLEVDLLLLTPAAVAANNFFIAATAAGGTESGCQRQPMEINGDLLINSFCVGE